MKMIEGGVTAAQGFVAGGVHCGIRKNKSKPDLAMIYSEKLCAAAAVYTQNLVKGAPILVTKKNIENGRAQAVICNSGNANTCNADGVEKAERMCAIAGEVLGIHPADVVVASTGVIGQVLPIEPIESAAQALKDSLSPTGSHAAAHRHHDHRHHPQGGRRGGGAGRQDREDRRHLKGSGMIHPNMATMLCFVTTDCAISPEMLQKAITASADETFNMISIDGDTSTNDTYAVLANGMAGNPEITAEGPDFHLFCDALQAVCRTLSKLMAGDGEGGHQAPGLPDHRGPGPGHRPHRGQIRHLLHPVQGRPCSAPTPTGAGCCAPSATPARRWTWTKSTCPSALPRARWTVCQNGAGIPFSEEEASRVLGEKEITILVHLHQGEASAEAYGCDLTYDYVKINGDYRT